ncbi:MAG: annexin [Candidatus Gastranaerophilales bacterium]|nr:annexin [Candidatus Gastranaerophilales bacterium]
MGEISKDITFGQLTSKQQEAIKNIKEKMQKNSGGIDYSISDFQDSIFSAGSYSELAGKVDSNSALKKIDDTIGLENFYNLLDSNGDGKLDTDEQNAFNNLNTQFQGQSGSAALDFADLYDIALNIEIPDESNTQQDIDITGADMNSGTGATGTTDTTGTNATNGTNGTTGSTATDGTTSADDSSTTDGTASTDLNSMFADAKKDYNSDGSYSKTIKDGDTSLKQNFDKNGTLIGYESTALDSNGNTMTTVSNAEGTPTSASLTDTQGRTMENYQFEDDGVTPKEYTITTWNGDGDDAPRTVLQYKDGGYTTKTFDGDKWSNEVACDMEGNKLPMEKADSVTVDEKSQKLADQLFEAMDGWGTDEASVHQILDKASPEDLQKIMLAYQEAHGESLMDAIKGDFSGKEEKGLKETLTNALKSQDDSKLLADKQVGLVVQELNNAMKGLGTDEDVVNSILKDGNYTPEQMNQILSAYNKTNGSLISDIKGDFSGKAEKELKGIALKGLSASSEEPLSTEQLDMISSELKSAMKGLGTDEDVVNTILKDGGYNSDQMAQILENYDTTNGSLIGDIKGDFSGKAEKELKAIVLGGLQGTKGTEAEADSLPDNKVKMVVTELNRAMKGLGTDEDAVSSILNDGNYTPAQLTQIMDAYKEEYGKSLTAAIKGDFSGSTQDKYVYMLNQALIDT